MSVGENYCSFNRDNWFQERKYVCRTAFLSVNMDDVCNTMILSVGQRCCLLYRNIVSLLKVNSFSDS